MQRRRGNQGSDSDQLGLDSSSPSLRRRQRSTSHINGDVHKQSSAVHLRNRPGFVILLCFIFVSWLGVEYIVFQMFDAPHIPSSNRNNDAPTKHPTTFNDQITFEPTSKMKGWRLKSAKIETNETMKYWKTNTPDEVPPLPPDTDPNTGEKLPPVIAYVTTLTKCGPKHRGGLDGAAVLLHSIRRNSHGWTPLQEQYTKANVALNSDGTPSYGGKGGRYRYRAYVIVDPVASPKIKRRAGECARYLQKIGYTILHRPPLVPLFPADYNEVSDIPYYKELVDYGYLGKQRPKDGPTALKPDEPPDKLRQYMHNDGCCGYTELLKLHVYGLVGHELAVHLDFDSLLLKPMDDLFDAMLGKGTEEMRSKLPIAKLPRSKEVDFSKPIDAAFTRDYNSVAHPKLNTVVGYQGGFLVVKPSLDVLERYRTILQRGEFNLGPRTGWGDHFGGFYGDLTFQGILPYYYEDIAPEGEHNEVELDRCIYNQMADNPHQSTYKFPRATPLDPEKMGFKDRNVCRDGRKDCSDTDCQKVHPKDSVTTHFTFCKKPWDCSEGLPGTVASPTCLGLLREWYAIRRELEDWWLLQSVDDETRAHYYNDKTITNVIQSRQGVLNKTQYFGYCDATGSSEGYRRLIEPDTPKA